MDASTIPLFPLNTVLFPGGVLPLQIFEVRYLDLVTRCIAQGAQFGVVSLTQGGEVRRPGIEEAVAGIGTMARITQSEAPGPGLLRVVCAGARRFRILSTAQLKHGLWTARVTMLDEDQAIPVPAELQNTAEALGRLIASLQSDGVTPEQMPMAAPYRLDDCGWVANRWCELLPIAMVQKQRLLELENPMLRLELVQDVMGEQGLL